MRRTVWILLITLLLQLVAGSAWALRTGASLGTGPTHCHTDEQAMQAHPDHSEHTADSAKASDSMSNGVSDMDSHHCCAVGLGIGCIDRLCALPRARPASAPLSWLSVSLRPDLRPPI